MICAADATQSEDPSGSDSTELLTLSLTGLLEGKDKVKASWATLDNTLGYPDLPPRKGHALAWAGCDTSNAAESVRRRAGTLSDCSMYSFGGWNPRWQEGSAATNRLVKFSLTSLIWSVIPSDTAAVCSLIQ